jgi:hypothetical protein
VGEEIEKERENRMGMDGTRACAAGGDKGTEGKCQDKETEEKKEEQLSPRTYAQIQKTAGTCL